MDRVLAARPLVGHVLVARFGEDVEQAYRAPEWSWWRGGSILCPILVLLRKILVSQVHHGGFSCGHSDGEDKDQSGEGQFVGTHGGGQKSRPKEKSRIRACKKSTVFVFFFFRPVFFSFFFWGLLWAKASWLGPLKQGCFYTGQPPDAPMALGFFTWFAGSAGRTQCLFERYP